VEKSSSESLLRLFPPSWGSSMTPMETFLAILPGEEPFTLGGKIAIEALGIQHGSLESVGKRLSHSRNLAGLGGSRVTT